MITSKGTRAVFPLEKRCVPSFFHSSFKNPFQGVCCLDISIDNIISIVDAPPVVVDIPNNLDTQGIFLRTDFGVQNTVGSFICNVTLIVFNLLPSELEAVCKPDASGGCHR